MTVSITEIRACSKRAIVTTCKRSTVKRIESIIVKRIESITIKMTGKMIAGKMIVGKMFISNPSKRTKWTTSKRISSKILTTSKRTTLKSGWLVWIRLLMIKICVKRRLVTMISKLIIFTLLFPFFLLLSLGIAELFSKNKFFPLTKLFLLLISHFRKKEVFVILIIAFFHFIFRLVKLPMIIVWPKKLFEYVKRITSSKRKTIASTF